ncbi:MAG: efflux RND transporter permease subunit [Sphingomonadales bacterium]|nr:efflux RND transporter permease subunit [Sphingomonadales bacterium]
MNNENTGIFDKLVKTSLSGSTPVFFIIASILLGLIALQVTPREEEPQIVVPIMEVTVNAPGLSARQVERQVTTPLESLLNQLAGIEYVYSASKAGMAVVTLRFFVGENREDALLNTYNKLYSNQTNIPGAVASWQVRPVEVDDVPILVFALYSTDANKYDDFALRRMADEIAIILQSASNTSEINVFGGRPRTVRIIPNPEAMAARFTTLLDISGALRDSNLLERSGIIYENGGETVFEIGDVFHSSDELRSQIIKIIEGIPVRLSEVATIIDGPDEANSYTWLDRTSDMNMPSINNAPMVAISVAKKRGSNAVWVASDIHSILEQVWNLVLPAEVGVEILRDNGETADEKVSDLVLSLILAVATVVVFIGSFLGVRAAIVVGLAIPVCYGATLMLDFSFGYTINRVTLFALILSLGLLVDDPITGVDNIERSLKKKDGSKDNKIIEAMREIRPALLMSTVTIILAFVPLAYITGMMGPYMAPMAFNVPAAVIISTLVAFLVTPWLSKKLLTEADAQSAPTIGDPTNSLYGRIMHPILTSKKKSKWAIWTVVGLFFLSALLPALRLVPLKLLPFDNKNELQIIIDMPEGTSLEATNAKAREIAAITLTFPEVKAIGSFIGTPSPVDFSGMVRGYQQRLASHQADLRITLVDKLQREHQSHAILLRLRQVLEPLNINGHRIKVVEVPPGPPVLSTIVAEVYGDMLTPYDDIIAAAKIVENRLKQEPLVTDVDTSVEDDQALLMFVTDKEKAALSGVSTADIIATSSMAIGGRVAGHIRDDKEALPLPITIRLPVELRDQSSDLANLLVQGRPGLVRNEGLAGLHEGGENILSIGELGTFNRTTVEKTIYHKNLRPVVYVTADSSGRTPGEIIADISADMGETNVEPTPWQSRSFFSNGGTVGWDVPDDILVNWAGEGEWRITIRVFRDMGLAFMFALAAIYIVLFFQTGSHALTGIIMSAIPLTIIGIMPGFFMVNLFGERLIAGAPDPTLFTATAMIGMIALAGIVIRNSLILVEFIKIELANGTALIDATIRAGAIRMRPVLLTAGTTLLGNVVIMFDPVFSGLALAIIFGIITSTALTLLVVPVVYIMAFNDKYPSSGGE